MHVFEICIFFYPTHRCFIFTSKAFKQSLIIQFHSASVHAERILLSVPSLCVFLQSLPLVLQPSRSVVLFVLGPVCVCVTRVSQNAKIMGADTITARVGGRMSNSPTKEKREELRRICHRICANVLARLVESSLSSLIT